MADGAHKEAAAKTAEQISAVDVFPISVTISKLYPIITKPFPDVYMSLYFAKL